MPCRLFRSVRLSLAEHNAGGSLFDHPPAQPAPRLPSLRSPLDGAREWLGPFGVRGLSDPIARARCIHSNTQPTRPCLWRDPPIGYRSTATNGWRWKAFGDRLSGTHSRFSFRLRSPSVVSAPAPRRPPPCIGGDRQACPIDRLIEAPVPACLIRGRADGWRPWRSRSRTPEVLPPLLACRRMTPSVVPSMASYAWEGYCLTHPHVHAPTHPQSTGLEPWLTWRAFRR